MAIPTLDFYTITALAQIFRGAKNAKEFSDALEELEKRDKMFTAQRDALEAFVEAWEKSHQLEKTDVAYRMAQQALGGE